VPQVGRSGQAQLRVVQVISGVSHVINRTDAQHARIFHTAAAFIWRGGLQHRARIYLEVQAVRGGRISDARRAMRIARAEQQYGLPVYHRGGRVERAGFHPRRRSGPQHWPIAQALGLNGDGRRRCQHRSEKSEENSDIHNLK
jgi:hypothetical protein